LLVGKLWASLNCWMRRENGLARRRL